MDLNNVNSSWNSLDSYILTDQPTTCGKCGARTSFEEINNEIQMHECLNLICGYKFITEDYLRGQVLTNPHKYPTKV